VVLADDVVVEHLLDLGGLARPSLAAAARARGVLAMMSLHSSMHSSQM